MNQVKYKQTPWGQEELWAHTEKYVGKILYINPHSRLSLQLHRQKEETIRVLSGRLYLHHEVDTVLTVTEMVEGDTFHVPVGTVHRFEARDESVQLLEVSTSELDDVVRLQDDYNRTEPHHFPSV